MSEDVGSPSAFIGSIDQNNAGSPRRQVEHVLSTTMHSRIFSEATVMADNLNRLPPGFN